jgi:hypothetical protein
MTMNDDAHPVATLIARLRAAERANHRPENTPPTPQTLEILKTPEIPSSPSHPPHDASAEPDQPQSLAVSDERNAVTQASETLPRNQPMTDQEFHQELGVRDLPVNVRKLLFAAPVEPVDWLDRYVELHDMEVWLARYDPFIDDRLVFAAGWLSDLLAIEIALRPARSRDELRTRIMILADSRADRPEHGHYDLVCETILRADIARLGLPADDPVVTHFEARMVIKKSRKSEG